LKADHNEARYWYRTLGYELAIDLAQSTSFQTLFLKMMVEVMQMNVVSGIYNYLIQVQQLTLNILLQIVISAGSGSDSSI
jgi:hypothetical protein